jgi:DNA-binding IclR family transcriptional regulator
MDSQFSPEALQVLRLLGKQAMDGYKLLKESGLPPSTLSGVANDLMGQGLIKVIGDLGPDSIAEASLSVPPSAKEHVAFLVRGIDPTVFRSTR